MTLVVVEVLGGWYVIFGCYDSYEYVLVDCCVWRLGCVFGGSRVGRLCSIKCRWEGVSAV